MVPCVYTQGTGFTYLMDTGVTGRQICLGGMSVKDGKKIRYNLIMGIAGQLIGLLLGIILPKLVITSYGSEINGLLASVTNIYAYIAIVEAGVAAASCQALYKPIAEHNRGRISAILSATNKYYHRSGMIYFLLIIAFAAFYPLLIKTEIPYYVVVLVILFNGLGNVINYFFHGKYLILLRADGKNFIRTGLESFTNALKQIAKIALISLGYNVIMVQLIAMFTSFAQMIYITYYIKKHYSWIDLKVEPDTASISQSKNVFVHEINYLITSNVDTVLLTVFTTLKTVSVYSLYNLLFGTINKLLRTVRDAVEFKIAHEYHKNTDTFAQMFHAFEVYYITLAFSCFSIANYFVIPFVKLYTKGVTDISYTDPVISVLFVLTNLLSAGRYPSDAMIHIAGHFKQTQNSAAIETAINLVTSLILVQFFGIAGALLGTILSSLYRTNYLIFYVNKNIIGRSTKDTYLCWGVNFVVFLIIDAMNRLVSVNLSSYVRIFGFCIPYAIAVVAFHVCVVSLCQPRAFSYVLSIPKKRYSSRKK